MSSDSPHHEYRTGMTVKEVLNRVDEIMRRNRRSSDSFALTSLSVQDILSNVEEQASKAADPPEPPIKDKSREPIELQKRQEELPRLEGVVTLTEPQQEIKQEPTEYIKPNISELPENSLESDNAYQRFSFLPIADVEEPEKAESFSSDNLLEAERIEAERIEAERIEAERIEAERIEAERIEAER
ncbi:MAG: hypothetical protein LBS40_05565, partial [Burkholderiales bacterium]|nr:hypothetical protein [Burkholderiales bacterium]